MSSQADLKRRLNALMKKPENMICSDCPERQPRWASLIVPPPGSPPDSLPIGAFCCLECSGSHRRLGVHISFVRSVNLDSWKEKEVLAMENGGNAKVNAIFEARLAHSGSVKPSNQASGPTRERFIRDKYERRKFYDANLMQQYLNGDLSAADSNEDPEENKGIAPGNNRRPLRAPSEAAKKRAEARKSRLSTKSSSPKKASSAAPSAVSAASVQSNIVDLLDFDSEPAKSTAPSSAGTHDPFSVTNDPFNPPAAVPPAPAPSQPISAPPTAAPLASTPASSGGAGTISNFTNNDPFSNTVQTTQTSKHMETTVSKETTATKEEYSLSMLETSTTSTSKPVMNSNDIMKLFNQPSSTNAMYNAGGGNGMGMTSDAFSGLSNMNPMSNGATTSNQYNGAGGMNFSMGGNGANGNAMAMPLSGGGQSLQQQQYMLQQQMLLLQQQQQMQMMMKQMNFNSTATSTSSSTSNGQSMSFHQHQQTTQMRTNSYTSTDAPGSTGFGFGDMAPMGGVTQYNQNTGGGGGISMSQLNMMNRVNNVNLSDGAADTTSGDLNTMGAVGNTTSKPKDDRFSDLGQFGFNS